MVSLNPSRLVPLDDSWPSSNTAALQNRKSVQNLFHLFHLAPHPLSRRASSASPFLSFPFHLSFLSSPPLPPSRSYVVLDSALPLTQSFGEPRTRIGVLWGFNPDAPPSISNSFPITLSLSLLLLETRIFPTSKSHSASQREVRSCFPWLAISFAHHVEIEAPPPQKSAALGQLNGLSLSKSQCLFW